MSADANKTMLVPVSQQTDTLTNATMQQESYADFKNLSMMRAKTRNAPDEQKFVDIGNPFLALASDIFKQVDILQNSYDIGSLDEVRNALIEEMDYFTEAMNQKGVEKSQIMLARYLLCTFVDEMIGTTYWGKDNNWANASLLGHFYNETYGGEKFFQALEELQRAPAKYFDLLELIYVCISLGFQGKYRIMNKGKMELDSIRENLYRQMKMMNVRQSKNFYAAHKVSSDRNTLFHKTSYKILALSIVVMLSLIYGILTFSLANKEDKAMELFTEKLNKYASESPTSLAAPKQPIEIVKEKNE